LLWAYLNTQGSSPSETSLKRIDDETFFDIIMGYSLKLPSFVQYFVVLSKSIFLHFWSISNKLTVRLILSKTNHIIEFYAVKKIHSFSFL
ncbi:hypothetical protein T01_8882, partial [Trichinella spiralis]